MSRHSLSQRKAQLDEEEREHLEEYKALAEEIGEDCKTVDKAIPSDRSDRALSEITTTGYEPNLKHGVAINVMPLSEAEIVPTTVEERVL